VIQIRALAEKQNGERRSENRDQVIERRCPVRPQEFDAAIVEQVGDERGQQCDVGKRRERRAVPDRILPGGHFRQHQRDQNQSAHGGQHEREAQRMDRRPLAQQHGVKRVNDLGEKEPDIAFVQLEMQ